nr:cation-transporting P-type ATPase [Acidimicrobiales bacterium]
PPWWRQLLGQMTHFFALMLWVAGVLAIVAGLPQLGIAIFVVILINGVFAFAQEYRAERAAERLRVLLPRSCVVIRDGRRRTIDGAELVVGDLVALAAGDRISADLTVREAHGLAVDTSLLTGESVPGRLDVGEGTFAGSFVVEGEALAVVSAVGDHTRLADIAALTRGRRRPPSPLARELHRTVRLISRIAIGTGVVFFGLALVLGTDAGDGFLFAVGVTVALVPEGLLPTVTLSLAVGAQRMADRHALVRRLESVETLGSTTFICTDKTGTLTRNQMEVLEVWTLSGRVAVDGEGYEPTGSVTLVPDPGSDDEVLLARAGEAAWAARLCSTGRAVVHDGAWVAEGDPMEAAIDALAARLAPHGVPRPAAADRVPQRRFPFDPRRRRMSVVIDGVLYVKGAPDAVLPRCTRADSAHDSLERLTAEGLRVIAVARRVVEPSLDATADDVERDLELLGLLGLEDPPRPAAADSLARCRTAGIRVAMVTGDHPRTAHAIAVQTGLALPDSPVLEGRSLPADDQELGELLDVDGVVVARVTPEDKLRIAQTLQARGHVVAMTGDGVNDGPALQQADIGIAMGASGTDVAREAADLVLLDDDFATVVAAVEQGRATFANLRRFLTYHLTDNVAELTPFVIWALSAGEIPLALGVLQILCLDIGTDLLPALALGAEPPANHTLERPPPTGPLLDRAVLRRVFGVLGPAEAALEMIAFLVALWVGGWALGDGDPPEQVLAAASGAAFAAVVIGQLANALACRSTSRAVWQVPWRTNPLMSRAIAAEVLALGLFLLVPPVADLLGQAPPPAIAWPVVLAAAPAVVAADTVQKAFQARRRRRRPSLST